MEQDGIHSRLAEIESRLSSLSLSLGAFNTPGWGDLDALQKQLSSLKAGLQPAGLSRSEVASMIAAAVKQSRAETVKSVMDGMADTLLDPRCHEIVTETALKVLRDEMASSLHKATDAAMSAAAVGRQQASVSLTNIRAAAYAELVA